MRVFLLLLVVVALAASLGRALPDTGSRKLGADEANMHAAEQQTGDEPKTTANHGIISTREAEGPPQATPAQQPPGVEEPTEGELPGLTEAAVHAEKKLVDFFATKEGRDELVDAGAKVRAVAEAVRATASRSAGPDAASSADSSPLYELYEEVVFKNAWPGASSFKFGADDENAEPKLTRADVDEALRLASSFEGSCILARRARRGREHRHGKDGGGENLAPNDTADSQQKCVIKSIKESIDRVAAAGQNGARMAIDGEDDQGQPEAGGGDKRVKANEQQQKGQEQPPRMAGNDKTKAVNGKTKPGILLEEAARDGERAHKPVFLIPGVMGTSMETELVTPDKQQWCALENKAFKSSIERGISAWVPFYLKGIHQKFDCCQIHALTPDVTQQGEMRQKPAFTVRPRRGKMSKKVMEVLAKPHAGGKLSKLGDKEVEALVSPDSIDVMVTSEIANSLSNSAIYFRPMLKQLREEGFLDGVTLHAVPYDFRRNVGVPTEFEHEYEALIWRLAETRKYGLRAVLAAHSMGSLFTMGFLRAVEDGEPFVVELLKLYFPFEPETGHDYEFSFKEDREDWILDTIDRVIFIGAPLAGAPSTLEHETVGSSVLQGKCRNRLWRQAHASPAVGVLAAHPRDAALWTSADVHPGPGLAYEIEQTKKNTLAGAFADWRGGVTSRRLQEATDKLRGSGVHVQLRVRGRGSKYSDATVKRLELGKNLYTEQSMLDHWAVSGPQWKMRDNSAQTPTAVAPGLVTSLKLPAVFITSTMGASTPLSYLVEYVGDHAGDPSAVRNTMYLAKSLPYTLTSGDGTVPSLSLMRFKEWAEKKVAPFEGTVVRPPPGLYHKDLSDDESCRQYRVKSGVLEAGSTEKIQNGCDHMHHPGNPFVLKTVLSAALVRGG